jgi:chemotaxis signal transduction protein
MTATAFVLCKCATFKFAIYADSVKKIHDNLSVQPIADTQLWFLGLAVVNGKLLPVSDLSRLLSNSSAAGKTLEVDPGSGRIGLKVDEVLDVVHGVTENYEPRNRDASLPEDVGLTLHGVEHEDDIYRILDLSVLAASNRFLDIGVQSA